MCTFVAFQTFFHFFSFPLKGVTIKTALIMQGTQIAGKLIRVCTQLQNEGATSDLKELMECAVSASWGK